MVYPNPHPQRLQARLSWRKLRLEMQTVRAKQIKLRRTPRETEAPSRHAELAALQGLVKQLLKEIRVVRRALETLAPPRRRA